LNRLRGLERDFPLGVPTLAELIVHCQHEDPSIQIVPEIVFDEDAKCWDMTDACPMVLSYKHECIEPIETNASNEWIVVLRTAGGYRTYKSPEWRSRVKFIFDEALARYSKQEE
jgi:hypothetical protein